MSMTVPQIMEAVAAGILTKEQGQKMILDMAAAQNGNGTGTAGKKKDTGLKFNVTAQGGLTLRPVKFGASPTNPYPFGWAGQWVELLTAGPEVLAYIYSEAASGRTALQIRQYDGNGNLLPARPLTPADLPDKVTLIKGLISRLQAMLPAEVPADPPTTEAAPTPTVEESPAVEQPTPTPTTEEPPAKEPARRPGRKAA